MYEIYVKICENEYIFNKKQLQYCDGFIQYDLLNIYLNNLQCTLSNMSVFMLF